VITSLFVSGEGSREPFWSPRAGIECRDRATREGPTHGHSFLNGATFFSPEGALRKGFPKGVIKLMRANPGQGIPDRQKQSIAFLQGDTLAFRVTTPIRREEMIP